MSVFGVFISSMKIRNRDKFNCELDITKNYLYRVYKAQKGRDPYFNIELIILPRYQREEEGKRWLPNAISIDRIDSTKPYMKGNVQFIASFFNKMKQDQSNKDLFNFAKMLHVNKFPYYGRLKHIKSV